jgi:predicted 3-demethylubiquinone-9 3-methyltransferase (glyoxalase superfamily)
MMQKIKPCLWFNDNGEEAAKFYTSLFPKSKIATITKYNAESSEASGQAEGSVMTVLFELAGQEFLALNGGPIFQLTPALSLFVSCESEAEIDNLFGALSAGGAVLMPLNEYPFAKKYAWVNDKFGLSWQLILSERAQKISPCMMFVGDKAGKAQEAMKHYTSIFANSKINEVHFYEPGDVPVEGHVAHGSFTLDGYNFIAMDSGIPHQFSFSEAMSFMVDCDSQQEIDMFWTKLTEGGAPSRCGWLTDKYGVSWQIIPAKLTEILTGGDTEKSHRTLAALMQMTKIDINVLQNA